MVISLVMQCLNQRREKRQRKQAASSAKRQDEGLVKIMKDLKRFPERRFARRSSCGEHFYRNNRALVAAPAGRRPQSNLGNQRNDPRARSTDEAGCDQLPGSHFQRASRLRHRTSYSCSSAERVSGSFRSHCRQPFCSPRM